MSSNIASIQKIQGGIAQDQRGHIRFVNDFDMSLVKRFYMIKNADVQLVRGWRAHRIEQRWFYVVAGDFEVELIQIDNWDNPAKDLTIERVKLESTNMEVLHVPQGYGTTFRALQPDSELLVFADHGIEHAPQDDYTWPLEYFIGRLDS
ncbi:WxcM-like domain-containing protein [Sphingobacterium kitahiroshimense]|uniref:WxcM-like domain-containing protein n=1 Tax=Sphingobacterium kitahiroshimense TaxID=470446 RepID=A0ABV0C2R6_9SPHI